MAEPSHPNGSFQRDSKPAANAPWSVDQLAKDGFFAKEPAQGLPGLALGSLRVALKAYAETYAAMHYMLHLFDGMMSHPREQVEFNHSSDFVDAATEAVLHFQHFAELALRGFLMQDHPLLGLDLSRNPVALHKVLHGDQLTAEEQEFGPGMFVGFSGLLERVGKLDAAGRISDARLKLVVQHLPMLRSLNTLRNRVWHSGQFVLLYPALDKFVAGHVLPFVLAITQLPEYADLRAYWRYRPLACGVDPLSVLVTEAMAGRYDVGKFALLKELVRAAYANPLMEREFGGANARARKRAELLADPEHLESSAWSVEICPVCGTNALVLFDDVETEGEDPETGSLERAWRYVWKVQCLCCSLRLARSGIENPSVYDLPIADFWFAEDL